MLAHTEMLVRITVGAALGGLIGYERDRHGRPVGLRTHLLVSLSAATFMVLSSQFVYFQHYGPHDLAEVDTSRIAASVVSGIGFLAGGAILRTGLTVQGLTTAAGLWLVTAIGMCAGAGMYIESAFATVMGLLALTLLRRLEDKDDEKDRFRVVVSLGEAAASARVLDVLRGFASEISETEHERRFQDEAVEAVVTVDVLVPRRAGTQGLVEAVSAMSGVRHVHVRRA